ncbi:hypothetical protein GCM10027030_21110 [Luteococcus sediminum]
MAPPGACPHTRIHSTSGEAPIQRSTAPRRALAPLALATLIALAGCSGSQQAGPTPASPATGQVSTPTGQGSGPADHPSVQVTADTSVPSKAPPVGDDVACSNRMRCYLKNPKKLSDEQWRTQVLPAVPGADKAPSAPMRPWAYGVFGLGEGRTEARDQPSREGAVVDDGYGILNHRVVFAFCRTAGSDPRQSWYLVEPMTPDAPPQVWVEGTHLEPYGHNGAIPTC